MVLRFSSRLILLALTILLPGRSGAACTGPPGAVSGLEFAAGGTHLFWEAAPGAGGTVVHDLLRSGSPTDFGAAAVCVESNDGVDLQAEDAAIPALGEQFHYLPRGESECGLGPMGTDSAGALRPQGRQCGSCISDATCDDGLVCNGAEICPAGGECQAGLPPDCGGFACDESVGGCLDSCVDDVQCAGGFGCVEGSCVTAIDVTATTDEPDAVPDDGVCAASSGACTLRAAIQTVNALGGPQIIRLPEGVVLLTRQGPGEDGGDTGDLDLHTSMVIRGVSAPRTWIDAREIDRVFHVHPTALDVTLAALKVQRGRAPSGAGAVEHGGGILNEGGLRLEAVEVNACITEGDGGGIWNGPGATLSLFRSTVSFNHGLGQGGGITNLGSLAVEVSTLSSNTTTGLGGGLYQAGDDASLSNVTVYRNTADTGGGLYLDPGATSLTMLNTVVASAAGGDCSGVPTSLGHNLSSDMTCDLTGAGDLQNVDPLLSELRTFLDAGIRTHYPLEGSPLNGAGDPGNVPPVDQNNTDPAAYPAFVGSVVQVSPDDLLGTGRVYVASPTEVVELDLLLFGATGTVSLAGVNGLAVHPDGAKLYAIQDSGLLHAIDTTTLAATPLLNVNSLESIAIHPDGTFVFVGGLSASDTPLLWAVDAATDLVAGTAGLPSAPRELAVQDYSPWQNLPGGGNLVYAQIGMEQQIRRFSDPYPSETTALPYSDDWVPVELEGGSNTGTFQEESVYSFDENAVTGDQRLAFGSGFLGQAVHLIDLPHSESPPLDLVRHPDHSRLYASQSDLLDAPRLHVVTIGAPATLTATLPDGGGEMAIHPAGLNLYAARFSDGVAVVSTLTNAVTTTVPIGGGGVAVAVRP